MTDTTHQDPMTDMTDDVLDAEVVKEDSGDGLSDETEDEVAASNKVASTLLSLQSLIERNANELDRLSTEVKQLRESLKNVFENDPELNEAEETAKKATQQIKERKQSVDNQPEVRQIKMKLGELKEEMKEIEETLNSHLINLFQMTGSNSFDTSDGDQREFVLRAKVKPKKK